MNRILIILVLALLPAATTTIAVAVFCACRARPEMTAVGNHTGKDGTSWGFDTHDDFGFRLYSLGAMTKYAEGGPFGWTTLPIRITVPDDFDDNTMQQITYVEVGWPFPAMIAHTPFASEDPDVNNYLYPYLRPPQFENVIRVSAEDGWYFNQILVPTRPVPFGFFANTLLITPLFFVVFGGGHAIRRSVRVIRGCCRKCGYDLRGMAHDRCPECGTAPKLLQ